MFATSSRHDRYSISLFPDLSIFSNFPIRFEFLFFLVLMMHLTFYSFQNLYNFSNFRFQNCLIFRIYNFLSSQASNFSNFPVFQCFIHLISQFSKLTTFERLTFPIFRTSSLLTFRDYNFSTSSLFTY